MTKNKTVLVTAGNTYVPIDKVRGITNIFRGRTGTAIAEYFTKQGMNVILLTSSPELAEPNCAGLEIVKFRTYDDLYLNMKELVCGGQLDIIIHSAAVSDYKVDGLFRMNDRAMEAVDNSGKFSSSYPELWMKMVPTEKIIDLIREPWGFEGVLVKFKLQVGMDEEELLKIARESLQQSKADLIVANTLEKSKEWALVVESKSESYVKTVRELLPIEIFRLIRRFLCRQK